MLIIINGLWDIVIANSESCHAIESPYKTLTTSLAAGSIKGFATVKNKRYAMVDGGSGRANWDWVEIITLVYDL